MWQYYLSPLRSVIYVTGRKYVTLNEGKHRLLLLRLAFVCHFFLARRSPRDLCLLRCATLSLSLSLSLVLQKKEALVHEADSRSINHVCRQRTFTASTGTSALAFAQHQLGLEASNGYSCRYFYKG